MILSVLFWELSDDSLSLYAMFFRLPCCNLGLAKHVASISIGFDFCEPPPSPPSVLPLLVRIAVVSSPAQNAQAIERS